MFSAPAAIEPHIILLKEGESAEIELKPEGLLHRTEIDMMDDSSLKLRLIAGKGDIKIKSRSGSRSLLELEGIFHTRGADKLVVTVESLFDCEDAEGKIVLRGAAEDSSGIECRGMIEVGENAKGFKGFLKEDFLILDPSASVELVPGLKINNDDVQVSHSAGVRRIDPEDLYYLASRGISQEEARKMMVSGFLGFP